jgi:hypothetical protein
LGTPLKIVTLPGIRVGPPEGAPVAGSSDWAQTPSLPVAFEIHAAKTGPFGSIATSGL